MRKIEEILRLKYEAGLKHRAIAQSCAISAGTVSEYIARAQAAGLSWPLPEGLSGEELEALLFPTLVAAGREIARPDWAAVHKELRRKSVTLSLLCVEYRQAQPDGYSYSQFCHHYRGWAKQLYPMMRQKHRAGEKLFIDYAGQTMAVVDPETGEVKQAQVFVAVLGASSYTYAEAHESQSLPNWISAHVRALAFLGGVPQVLVADNLKAGVKSPHRYEPDINPTYQEFARHYGLAGVPTRSRKPKDKAKVEVGVQVVERWVLARLRDRTFFSLAELNQAMRELLADLNDRPIQHLGQSRRELFLELDQPALKSLPKQPYEFAQWLKACAGSLDQALRLVLTGIQFLRAVRRLATLDIRKEDAEMLIAIFRVTQEESVAQVDDLYALLPAGWDEAKVARSLERLEALACIEMGTEGIVLNETIIVQRVD
jgi:transposase